MYEEYYEIIQKIDEDYYENQFFEIYYKEINNVIANHFIFDEKSNLISIKQPLNLSEFDKITLQSYLWKIKKNREFSIKFYSVVEIQIKELLTDINTELKK